MSVVSRGTAPPERYDPLDPSSDMETALARLRSLIEADAVDAARVLVPQIVERWPDAPRVQHWARVLEPPRAKVLHGHATESFDQESAWLRQHRTEYPGCWIAVHQGDLIAADPSLSEVYRRVRDALGERRAVIYYQGEPPK